MLAPLYRPGIRGTEGCSHCFPEGGLSNLGPTGRGWGRLASGSPPLVSRRRGQGVRKCQVSAKKHRCSEKSAGLRVRGLGPGLALSLTCCLTLGSSLLPESQFPQLHNDEVGLQIPIVSHPEEGVRALAWAVRPLPAPATAGDLHLLVPKRGRAGLAKPFIQLPSLPH